ncbi:MAG TPA: dihydroneopterin aldolase [Afifellaceae bacterium]|nr:dihydroneopterin aldolase [Afifellaceae bacterium]
MADRILVRDLVLYAYHGVHPEEQRLGQRFEVDITCSLDLREAARQDVAGATVSYASLVEIAQEISAKTNFFLIEALAETIAGKVLDDYPQIGKVTVQVRKPSAPIPATLGYVAVEVTRGRGG